MSVHNVNVMFDVACLDLDSLGHASPVRVYQVQSACEAPPGGSQGCGVWAFECREQVPQVICLAIPFPDLCSVRSVTAAAVFVFVWCRVQHFPGLRSVRQAIANAYR